MGAHPILCAGLALGLAFVAGRAAADEDPGQFEVIVLRGASVARVSGDASGAIREQTLREDPRPARREPAPAAPPRDAGSEIIVVLDAGSSFVPAFGLAWPFFDPGRFPPRHHAQRHVYRPGPKPPDFHHGRGGGHRHGKGHGGRF